MHIRVEKPVAQRVLQEQLQNPRADGNGVQTGGLDRVDIAHRDALGPAKGHHPTRAVPPHGRGNDETVILGGIGHKFGRRRRLKPQVQFAMHDALKMGDDIGRTQTPRRGRDQFDHPCGKVERVDVLLERAVDTGAQNLDRDLLAGFGQNGLVHLCDGRGGYGFAELREHLVQRGVQFLFDRGLGQIARKRRQLILQDAQLHGQIFAHDIGARRQDLAELDIGRAQRGQGAGRGRQRFVALIAQPLERPCQDTGQHAQLARGLHRLKHDTHRAGTFHRGAGADQPPDIMGTTHVRFSIPNAGQRCPWTGYGI